MKMLKLGAVLLLALGLCHGQGLLDTAIQGVIPYTTDSQRDAAAVSYANARFTERENNYNAIEAAVGTNPAVSLNLSAHNQLSFLGSNWLYIVKMAEYYNDYAFKLTEGMSDNEQVSILDFNQMEISKSNPSTNSIPSYPDCASACNANERYRTLSGMCNNLDSCYLGIRGITYRRLLPADYGKNGAPREADTNPWDIARDVFGITWNISQRVMSDRNLSQMVMTFGQFLSHDMMATPVRSALNSDGNPINVDCTAIGSSLTYDECLVMTRTGSMQEGSFIRSAPGVIDKEKKFKYGNREQMNMQSAFIDASHLYGASSDERDKLYDSATGLMKVTHISIVEPEQFPPTDANQYCEGADGNSCFISGDGRINIHLGMMMLHTLFTREHNYIAEKIIAAHPDWSGSKIFEETRRIIGAYMQSITYKQFLPLIIGETMAQRYGLDFTTSTTYDASVDPSIINSFATAAFRYGHSQVYNSIRMATTSGELAASASLSSTMFNPDRFYATKNGFTVMRRYLMGIALDQCEAVDTTFARVISTDLFKSKTPSRESHSSKGVSLPALNLQRGRDHGLPTCGEFMDLIKDKTGDVPENINDPVKRAKDLFHCGLEETHVTGGEVGLTFGHIIAAQFRKTMLGDRFFYTHSNGNANSAFTEDEIKEIDKVSLAQMICRHVNVVQPGKKPGDIKLAPDAFHTVKEGNPLLDCDDVILPNAPDLAKIIP